MDRLEHPPIPVAQLHAVARKNESVYQVAIIIAALLLVISASLF
jgi:hypothetical protein